MELFVFARVIHILAVVMWIGGVAMVTTVLIPTIRSMRTKEEQIRTFETIEGKFSVQAKITTVLTGLSGFFMLHELHAWDRYLEPRYWWVHAMTFVWLLFTIILFILEPLVVHRLFKKHANENPQRVFKIIHRAHWILLSISLITIAEAVAGSHGWFWVG